MTPLDPLRSAPGVFAKIEYENAARSVKHRALLPRLRRLLDEGRVGLGQVIVLRSAGSAGVAAAWAGRELGLVVHVVAPPELSRDVLVRLETLGARCTLSPYPDGEARVAAIVRAEDAFYLEQNTDREMPRLYMGVVTEVLDQLPEVDVITVGIGTGMTFLGALLAVDARQSRCGIVGVEPAEAAVLQGAAWANHGIPGLSPPFARPMLDAVGPKDLVTVASSEAQRKAAEVAELDDLAVGISSGATIVAAERLLRGRGARVAVAICASACML